MSYSRGSRYESRSYSDRQSSRSRYRSRSVSADSSDVENPGNNLYVTGLSARVTDRDLEKHFSTEGEVIDASIVLDPWTRESRGFGFVTMATLKEADRCIKYLDRSVLEGRVITVEKILLTAAGVDVRSCSSSNSKDTQPNYQTMPPQPKGCMQPSYYFVLIALFKFPMISSVLYLMSNNYLLCPPCSQAKRRRGRTPTPGRYLGTKSSRARRYSPSYSPVRRDHYRSHYSPERDRSYSPYGRGRSHSYDRERSYSPRDRRRSYSPYGRRRSYSPYGRRRSYSPCDRSYSPYGRRRSYSPYGRRRSYSPYDRRRSYSPHHGHCHRSRSPYSYRRRGRSYSRSVSPQESYSRSCSLESGRSTSSSPRKGFAERKLSRSGSSGKRRSRESYSHSRSSFSSISREH